LFTLVHKDEDQLSSLILRRPWNVKKSFLLSSFSKWTVKNNEIKTKIDSSLFNVQIKDPLPLQAVGCKKNLPSRTFSQNIFLCFFSPDMCSDSLIYARRHSEELFVFTTLGIFTTFGESLHYAHDLYVDEARPVWRPSRLLLRVISSIHTHGVMEEYIEL